MSKLKRHHWFWMVSVFFLMLTIYYMINVEHTAIDISSNDPYFVIPDSAATKIFTVLFFVVGFIYWLFFYYKTSLNPTLSKVHTAISIGSVFVYGIGKFGIKIILKSNVTLVEDSSDLNLFIVIMVLIVLTIQIIFIFNILLSVLKHVRSKNRKLN